jgi:hypothetical protein
MLIDTPAQQVGTAGLVLVCSLAFWKGAKADKVGALVIAVTWLATPFVERRGSWYEPQYGILLMDSLTLIGLVAVALVYHRRWPICGAAFQTFSVLTHLAFVVNPHALYRAYFYADFSMGFLLLGSLFAGVLIEPRDRPSPSQVQPLDRPRERRPA